MRTSIIWLQALKGRPGRQITQFHSDSILAFAWSPDEKKLQNYELPRGFLTKLRARIFSDRIGPDGSPLRQHTAGRVRLLPEGGRFFQSFSSLSAEMACIALLPLTLPAGIFRSSFTLSRTLGRRSFPAATRTSS